MADNQYRIELGIDLNDKQLNTVKTTISNLVDKERKINLDIDFNIKNANKLAEVGREIEQIKQSLKDLNNVGSVGKGKSPISIDSKSLETSLNKIHETIKKVQNAFGKVDKNKGVQSLLTTVNKISKELANVSKQFEGLNRNLSSLSGKDFSLNFDFGFSNSSKNPEQAIKELKMLKKEVAEYEDYFRKHYSIKSNEDPINRLLLQYNQRSQVYGIQLQQAMSKGSDAQKIAAHKEYLNLIKETAAIGNISLAPVEFRLAESGEFVKVRNEASETKKQLQELFSGGINAENLHRTLTEIAQDLRILKESLTGVTSEAETPINKLTQSFNRLSSAIEEFASNAKLAENALGNGLNTTVSDGGTEKAIQDQKELAQASTQSTNAVVQGEERKQQAFRETANESQRLSDGAEKLKSSINFNHSDIDSMKQSFQELGIAIDSVTVNLKNGVLDSFTVKGTDGIERTISATQRLDDELVKITQSFAKANSQAEKIEFKIDTGKFSAQITKVTSDFNKLSIKSDDVSADISQLKQEFNNMQTAAATGDIQKLINSYKEYERILESVNNKLDIYKTKQQEANRQQKQKNDDAALNEAKKALSWDIDYYLQKNTAAAKEFGDTIRKIRAAIDTCDDSDALKKLKTQFENVKREANVTLKSTQTFGDKIKKQWEQYSAYFGVAEIFMWAEQGLRSMFEQVKLIDSAMTELKKVTNETDEAYSKFLTNAADRAKEIGTTIDGLVSSTADFARLGYGFEDAQGLAEVANIYAVVGDEIEGVEGATESLISTMAAFKNEMNGMSNTDFAMSIIDKFNEIGKLIA